MAKQENVIKSTRKQAALSKQEKKQKKIILTALIVVAIAVVGSIAFGLLNEFVFKLNRPVATVNGEKIMPAEFEKQVKFNRFQLIQQYLQYAQYEQQMSALFGNDPQMSGQFTETLNQIQQQLDPSQATLIGSTVLDQLTNEILINQEAEKLGISVSDEEVNEAFQAAFGYFPGGTPTAQPTATTYVPPTLSPEQIAIVTLTPTPEPTEVLATATPEAEAEPTEEAEPLPTATAYTETMFGEQISSFLSLMDQLGIGIVEADLRDLIYNQLLYEKVRNAVTADVVQVEEQVWARHILLKDEASAQVVLDSLAQGEDWAKLAAELSLDTSNKDNGGDLGWFPRGQMVSAFEDTAFSLEIGAISEPVKTEFGYHIIQLIGKENRPLSASVYQSKINTAFGTWLDEVTTNATIDVSDNWAEVVPTEPLLTQETLQILQETTPQ